MHYLLFILETQLSLVAPLLVLPWLFQETLLLNLLPIDEIFWKVFVDRLYCVKAPYACAVIAAVALQGLVIAIITKSSCI